MNFDSKYIWESLPLLLQGLQLTLIISLSGLLGGFIIGLLAGTCRALAGKSPKRCHLFLSSLFAVRPSWCR